MKRLLAICVLLGACLSLSLAQGIQGSVKLDGKATVATTGHAVALSWSASQNATSYSIYRGTKQGGPYLRIASGVQGTNSTDLPAARNQTLYYVITAVIGTNESGYSNETVAVIP